MTENLTKISYDMILKKSLDAFEQGEYQAMLAYAVEAVGRNPYHLMANYLLAIAYSNVGCWLDSYSRLCYLEHLQKVQQEEVVEGQELSAMKEQAESRCLADDEETPEGSLHIRQKKFREIQERQERLEQGYFTTYKPIDQYFRKADFFGKEYYLGRYLSWGSAYMNVTNEGNCLTDKVDIYPVEAVTRSHSFTKELPCIVPVVPLCEENKFKNCLHIQTQKETYDITAYGYKKYNYYRIDEPTVISSENMMMVGKPIPLQHDPHRKKLILSIFLDSFNWKVVKEKSLRECMPNTAAFFQDGLVFEEYYAGSEFTYPSVASYWTGMRPSHHKVLDGTVGNALPAGSITFPELLQENGYFTAKIGGNDTVTPDYGYIRGIHRTLYQNWQQNFYADQAVHQTLEHMQAFGGADQYIWLDIPDLHDVAGMWDMPLSVQAACPMRVNEIDFTIRYPGTLYQTPSSNRRYVYLKEMESVDRQLGRLYRYIQENYQKDEVIVTLFSDHGNAFNVDKNQPFLSWQRENVPLMIYGPDFSKHSCDELVETIDYGRILCHLAGITDKRLDRMDGSLPAVLGGEEKEYVFAQSQHPDREYCAFVGTKQYRFYLESCEKVDRDCRIPISAGARVSLYDRDDREIKDSEIIEKCKEIVWENIRDFAY